MGDKKNCPFHSQYDNHTAIRRSGLKKMLLEMCNCEEEVKKDG